MRLFPCVLGGIVLASCTELSLLAQEKATTVSPQGAAVSVPFVGCASDGQVGPQEAPNGTSTSVSIGLKAARQLAYYTSAQGVGVLAPRGWYCFGIYGSGGDTLFVSPKPIDTANIFSAGQNGFSGPAIEISHRFGDTSGRFDVAEVIARVFPAYKAFVTGVMEGFDLPVPFGPYRNDMLTYKGKTVVEYKTPAETEGLGTRSRLKKNGSPIAGAAILIGQTPDLLLLSVRLPADLAGLTSAIVGQAESDATRLHN